MGFFSAIRDLGSTISKRFASALAGTAALWQSDAPVETKVIGTLVMVGLYVAAETVRPSKR